MNATGIEWCDATLNPIVGCTNGCAYCYARRFAKRNAACPYCRIFTPHLHRERLAQLTPRQKPRLIFMDSMSDWWDPLVPQAWRNRCWEAMDRAPQHTYLLLTKQPQNMTERDATAIRALGNVWVGYSWDGTDTALASRRDRIAYQTVPKNRLWCSYEPMLGPQHPWPASVRLGALRWLVLGAQTGPRAVLPERRWVEAMVEDQRWLEFALFAKDNLIPVMGEAWVREHQNWPPEMKREEARP